MLQLINYPIKGRKKMKKITQTFEDLFADIAFEEERTCKSSELTMKSIIEKLENNFIAIAFAEAGEFKTIKGHKKRAKH
jgi:hypothetical protein